MKTLILCGGSGTRLWPLSRTERPKQFVPLIDQKSLFDMTIERNSKLCSEFIVVVNEKQVHHCEKSLTEKFKSRLIIEPAARNTAPAVALACFDLNPDDIVFVVPSDHLIEEGSTYYKCVEEAKVFAEAGFLVTFGIEPKYPETGYGYIESKGNDVLSFKEKPDEKTAKNYIDQGNYYWNSGMFCFKASVFLSELQELAPNLYKQIKTVYDSKTTNGNRRIFQKELMLNAENISIDYAVMEKSKKVKVVPSPFKWSDLGSFDALFEELQKDENGNSLTKDYVNYNSSNNLVIGGKRVIATFDVNDLVIVDTPDAILIGKRGKTQDVKKIVESLQKTHPKLLD